MSQTQYAYKVRDAQGRFSEGKVEAASEAAVADRLRAMGYVPLQVRPANVGMQREINLGFKQRIKPKDLAVFARQFATMIDAGLSMLRALTIMSEQVENEELRKVLRGVRQDIEGGQSLSAAFTKWPRVFPPLRWRSTALLEALRISRRNYSPTSYGCSSHSWKRSASPAPTRSRLTRSRSGCAQTSPRPAGSCRRR